MIHIIRKPKIIVDCFTYRTEVSSFSPIQVASRFYPEWFKKLPNEIGADTLRPGRTMKYCAGFIDLFQRGFIVPMWSDLRIKVFEKGTTLFEWQFSDLKSEAFNHSASQRGSYLSEDEYVHLKLESPWLCRTKENVDWTFIQPMWNFDNPFEFVIPPGVLGFKYQFATNINMFIKKSDSPKIIQVNHGQPMAHIIPLSDKRVVIKNHLVSEAEFRLIEDMQTNISFLGKFKKIKDLLKAKENRKCPFGFGS